MKIIVILIAIIILLFIFKGSSENFVEVNQAIFNQVEIPTDSELQKDPYYQSIKNTDFPCMCGEGKEKNSNNECVPFCPTGQTRFTNGICYPPCPTGQTRFTNGICYPPCPSGQTRHTNAVCYPPCPVGMARDAIGACANIPCPSGQTRHTNAICYPPCPTNQTRDSEGVCKWDACPSNSTLNNISGECPCNSGYRKAPGRTGRNDLCYPVCQQTDPLKIGIDVADMDINGNCICRQGYVKANNGQCYKPCISPSQRVNDNGSCSCAPGYKNLNLGRDLNCQPDNCPTNSTLIPGGWNNTGICQCNSGFQKPPGKNGDRDPCYQNCQPGWDMQSDGTCKYREINWGLQCPDGSSVAYNTITNQTYCQSNIYDETDTSWKYSITG